jgi:hypothetical protein
LSRAATSDVMAHEIIHGMQDLGLITRQDVETFGGNERIAYAYQKWVADGKHKTKTGILERIGDFLGRTIDALKATFGSQEAKQANVLRGVNAGKAVAKRATVRRVKTPQFKNWFGDWQNDPANASKVVNKSGKPLEVFHGTLSDKFGTFEKREHGAMAAGNGFYFAEDPTIAKSFFVSSLHPGHGHLITAHLNIRKPFDFDTTVGKTDVTKMGSAVRKIGGSWAETEFHHFLKERIDKLALPPETITGYVIWNAAREAVGKNHANDVLSAMGYDGLVHTSQDNFGGVRDNYPSNHKANVGRVWVAFAPNQIKHSKENRGSFDPENPDMRFGGPIEGDKEARAVKDVAVIQKALAGPKSSDIPIDDPRRIGLMLHALSDKRHAIHKVFRSGKIAAAISYHIDHGEVVIDHVGSLVKGAGREAVEKVVGYAARRSLPIRVFGKDESAKRFWDHLGLDRDNNEHVLNVAQVRDWSKRTRHAQPKPSDKDVATLTKALSAPKPVAFDPKHPDIRYNAANSRRPRTRHMASKSDVELFREQLIARGFAVMEPVKELFAKENETRRTVTRLSQILKQRKVT